MSSTLPPRPPSPIADSEDKSSPRKRPRTRAPPQAAATASTAKSTEAPSTPREAPAADTPLHTFSIQPLHRFRGASATIQRPREIAHFSYDDDHIYRPDDSGINYYVPPPMGVDLKEGFDTFRHYEEKEDPHLDSLLKALMDSKTAKAHVKADFMTWRGMMTKVC